MFVEHGYGVVSDPGGLATLPRIVYFKLLKIEVSCGIIFGVQNLFSK